MPKWWDYEYDHAFLTGVARYGFSRGESFIEADDLPFKEVHQRYLKSIEVRKTTSMAPSDLVDGKFEEKFWMRDSVAIKRLELLVTLAETPIEAPRKGRKRNAVKALQDNAAAGAETSSDPIAKAHAYAPKVASKLGPSASDHESGGDTDEMLAKAEKIIKKRKQPRKFKKEKVPAPSVLHDDEVAAKMEELKSNHAELSAGHRLPSLASLIPEESTSTFDAPYSHTPPEGASTYDAAYHHPPDPYAHPPPDPYAHPPSDPYSHPPPPEDPYYHEGYDQNGYPASYIAAEYIPAPAPDYPPLAPPPEYIPAPAVNAQEVQAGDKRFSSEPDPAPSKKLKEHY